MSMFLQLIWAGISVGVVYGLIGVGYSIVYNSSRVVNFGQGEFYTLGAMLVIAFTGGLGTSAAMNNLPIDLPLPIAIALAIVVAVLIGLLVERVFFRQALKISPWTGSVLGFGLIFLFQGIDQLVFGKENYFAPVFVKGPPISFLGINIINQSLWVILAVIVVAVLLWAYFFRTSQGLAMRAGAENPTAARLMGISILSLVQLSFAIAAAAGAIAGIMIAPMVIVGYDSGLTMTLKAFASAVLGGMGNVFGALIGGLVIGLLEAFAGGYISTLYKPVIVFALLILILMYKPNGIFGKTSEEEV
jgi:branched-chain amino acid transport system permease protein